MTVKEKLQLIKTSVARLLKEKEKAEAEVQRLEAKLAEFGKLLDNQKTIIKNLEDQNKIIKLAETINVDPSVRNELKLKINEMIREIDRCLAKLNE